MGEWISVAEAAEILEITPRTIQRSLAAEERRTREWGAEGAGWRHKPLAERTIYQLRRSVVLNKAGKAGDPGAGAGKAGDPGAGAGKAGDPGAEGPTSSH